MFTTSGRSVLRLIILLLVGTTLLSCGGGSNSARNDSETGIAFRLKWPLAKSVGSIPAGVVTVRMTIFGPGMTSVSHDFAASAGTGSIANVPVGSNRTITFQGLASNSDIIYQADVSPVTLVQGQTYNCGTVAMSAVVTPVIPTAPSAPSGLSATAVSASQINLAWVDNANNETGYRIERKTGADGSYAQIATVAANDTIYNDTSLSASTVYYYQVKAFNGVGDSAYSDANTTTSVVAPASTYSISGTITSAGSALAGATVTRSGNGTTTTTTDSSGNYIFSGVQNGSYTLTPLKTGYTFSPVSLPATVDGANLSAMNFAATAVSIIPAAPSSLSATVVSSNVVNLAWVDRANNETGYQIERKTGSGGTYVLIPSVAANVTIYSDTSLSASTIYYYRVRAVNSIGPSEYCSEVSAVTPANVYGISGTITNGGFALAGVTVTLAGSGSSSATTDSSGNYSFVGVPDGVYTLTPGIAGYGFSPASLQVPVSGANRTARNFAASANTTPNTPSNLSAAAVSSSRVNLSWIDNANNETGYLIERKNGSGGTYDHIASVAANAVTYNDTALSASTDYSYRVRATNAVGDSASTAEVNVSTPVAPTYPDLLRITGGTYTMGDGTAAADNAAHQVTLSDFYIGRREVTQGEWLAIMGDNPSLFLGCGANCPVENVSWNRVQDFIMALNAQSGKSYRLPTEAEWEYAARSGGQVQTYSGGSDVNAVAWYSGNSGGTTHQVGSKQGNGLGIYDMSGNVWEWVSDWYSDIYYGSSPPTNPAGPASGTRRVLRGGSWKNVFPGGERTTYRASYIPIGKDTYIGFRLAASVQ